MSNCFLVFISNTDYMGLILKVCYTTIQQVGATTQLSALLSESISPPRIPMDNITILSVNLSVPGYKPISLRSPGLGSPPARPQITSVILQLDGPMSLPTISPTQERMGRLPD